MWIARTRNIFGFIRSYGYQQNILAFGNSILIVGMPEPVYWIAQNDNKAKP